MTKSSLSDRVRAIILGSLLGDGSLRIHRPYRNARFSFRHSVNQTDYFHWKANQLKEVSSERSAWEQPRDGFGGTKLRYQSLALESLTELYRLTHRQNRLDIRRRWLNQLTPLSLAIWWLDDGSLTVNTRKGVFCTDGFSQEGVKRLAKYLSTVWDIGNHIGKVKPARFSQRRPERYRIWLRSTEELKKFLRIILPHVPVPAMLPKVILLYRDSQLQQRWISEVGQLSKFPRNVVERYAAEKRSRWQRFRE